jgi:phage tail-like protein
MFTPPLGFHFRVQVLGLPPLADDLRFIEVGGLAVESAQEEVPEGGENRYTQKYPGRSKYTDLTLKRGLLPQSAVRDWARNAIEDLIVVPMPVDVTLLNDAHEPLMTWHLANAYPVKWSVSDLNATANAFVVESMQLSYQYFRLDRP